MSESETIRETAELSKDGRIAIPENIKVALDLKGKKAYCQLENYGKDKILITILSRWTPTNRTPGKDVIKK